jgi:hypothetical protein
MTATYSVLQVLSYLGNYLLVHVLPSRHVPVQRPGFAMTPTFCRPLIFTIIGSAVRR